MIKFGTDGWRAIIADTYTFANVEKVARATGMWVKKNYGKASSIILGYDTRFGGQRFAERTAEVFGTMGIHVTMSATFTTTPAISWAAREFGHNAGIVITASHNPPEYNGFKIKADFGGPATPEQIAEIEAELAQLEDAFACRPFAEIEATGLIQRQDLTRAYTDMLREKLDIAAIQNSGLKIAHDPMYGAGQGIVTDLLGAENVVELHAAYNPSFNGQAPEPIAKNLKALSETILAENCDVGLANDGDADRIGLFDERGQFVDSHRIFALLVKYLAEEKGLRGDIVKTFSTTHMLDKMGAHYGLAVQTTKVGFKYISPKMVAGDVLVGGEESGGMAVKGHVPERDGIYIGLLVVEMMVKRKKTLSALVEELLDQFGPHYTSRTDLHTTPAKKEAFLHRLKTQGLDEINGHAVHRTDTLDGFKFFTDQGWLMVRPSGTEPVLRIYSEAASPADADTLVSATVALLDA